MAKILILGCGDVGTRLGRLLSRHGHDVTGVRRRSIAADVGFRMLAVDVADRSGLQALGNDFDQLCYIVSADGRTEASYHAVYDTGLGHVLERFPGTPMLFVSSTSVYGQSHGEWVDEVSATLADTFNGRHIGQAERRILAAHPDNLVVRLSGIYGPGRDRLLKLAANSPDIQREPPYYTNRIHVDDAAGTLDFLLRQRLAGKPLQSIYLASDDDPAPMWDVLSWLAEQLQCPPPKPKSAADGSSMNKRCRNDRLRALGYAFRYPSFRDGYGELLSRWP